MHKWLPIKNSFVSIKNSPTNLVFELIIQKNFYSQTRLVGLIYMHTKEFLIGSHLCIGSIIPTTTTTIQLQQQQQQRQQQ